MQILIHDQSTVKELSQAIESDWNCYSDLLGHSEELEQSFLDREIPQGQLCQMVMDWIADGDECANF